MNKRTFLKNTTLIGLGSIMSFKALSKMVDAVAHLPADAVADDDDFWRRLRGSYKLKPDYINLENGHYCIMPQVIEQAYLNTSLMSTSRVPIICAPYSSTTKPSLLPR